MTAPEPPGPTLERDFRLGEALVQPGRLRLFDREGETQSLNPKAMQVLCLLAANAGQTVTKQALLDTIWADTHVGDDVLTNAVYELRRALGDKARSPWAIETVHRTGYCVIAPVEPVEPTSPDPRQESSGSIPRPAVGPPEPSETPSPATPATKPAPPSAEDRPSAPEPSPQPPSTPRRRWPRPSIALALALGLAMITMVWFESAGSRPDTTDGASPTRGVVLAELPEVDDPTVASGLERLQGILIQDVTESTYLDWQTSRSRNASSATTVQITAAPSAEGEPVRLQLEVDRGPGAQVSHSLVGSRSELEVLLETARRWILLELEVHASGFAEEWPAIRSSRAGSFTAWLAYRDGETARNRNEFDTAIADLRRAVELDPRFAHAWSLLANLYDIVGHRDLATTSIGSALEHSTDWPPLERLALLRRRAQIEGQTTEELRLLKELLAANPASTAWRFRLAWFYKTHERDCRKSEERYADLLDAPTADDWEGMRVKYRSDHALACGEPKQAVELLEAYVAKAPSADTFDQLAYAQILTGDWEGARESLDAARRYDSDSHLTTLLEGRLFVAQGRYGEAEESFETYRAQFEWPSTEAEALLHLARARLAAGDVPRAHEAVERALAAKDWSVEILALRGLIELHMLGPGVATETLTTLEERGVATAASRYEVEHYHYLAGSIALAQGNPDRAVDAFRRAVDLHPEDPTGFLFALAQALWLADDPLAAEAQLEAALRFNPRHRPSLCALADLHEAADRPDLAQETQAKCRAGAGAGALQPWFELGGLDRLARQGASP